MVHIEYSKVDAGAFAHLHNLLFNLFACLCHHLFDTCGVYAAVGDKFMERQACYLTTYGIETGEDYGVGRVVDDNLDTSERLKCADIAAFTTDDATLDLLVLEVENTDGVLDGMLCGGALDGFYDDFLGLLVGGHFGLLDNVHYGVRRLGFSLFSHHIDKLLLGFVGCETGYMFEFLDAFLVDFLCLGFTFVEDFYLTVQIVACHLEFVAFFL